MPDLRVVTFPTPPETDEQHIRNQSFVQFLDEFTAFGALVIQSGLGEWKA